jgi:hypothetical protein
MQVCAFFDFPVSKKQPSHEAEFGRCQSIKNAIPARSCDERIERRMMRLIKYCPFASFLMEAGFSSVSYGQSFGVELQNTLMSASGGMGVVSIARLQDLTSAMNANPASLSQFRGI